MKCYYVGLCESHNSSRPKVDEGLLPSTPIVQKSLEPQPVRKNRDAQREQNTLMMRRMSYSFFFLLHLKQTW